ncbi:Alpha-ribazole phosphatase [Leminorella grimontii]|nr:Alpha-ribazole phosphatase [Leminorella grimontii]
MRHGETQVNQRGVYAGLTDYGLNESGVEQGKRLAKAIGHLPFDVAVASGLRRTRQTAFLIAPDARCEPIEEFNEIAFGEWEDRHYQEIALNDAENYEKWCADWQSVAPPAGESFEHFSARIAQTFSAWLKTGGRGLVRNGAVRRAPGYAALYSSFPIEHAAGRVLALHLFSWRLQRRGHSSWARGCSSAKR